MDIKILNRKVGNYCKDFRMKKLDLSLTDFAKVNNENLKNIHSFEYGRSNNIKYIYLYYNNIMNQEDRLIFMKGLFNIL